MAPDVAIVGEVRDEEALPLLRTLSSGQGLHHDPRRISPSGTHPAALHQPISRGGSQPAALGIEHPW
ncbi:MAG: hypothetical protein IPH38_20915 [Candidatus Microthrix sp.]|nr:hypothetical protein [Candidatus Microthrix sp.]